MAPAHVKCDLRSHIRCAPYVQACEDALAVTPAFQSGTRPKRSLAAGASARDHRVMPAMLICYNEPVSADAEMHAPKYDFGELEPLDEHYLEAVVEHLGWLYTPALRKLRRKGQ
jgi:hypothetical protein